MPFKRRSLGAPALVAALALLPGIVYAEGEPSSDGRWRILLHQQLKAEKGCDLHEVLMFNELKLGDETTIEGRISCIDGREFNFNRKRPHQKFDLHLCQPSVC